MMSQYNRRDSGLAKRDYLLALTINLDFDPVATQLILISMCVTPPCALSPAWSIVAAFHGYCLTVLLCDLNSSVPLYSPGGGFNTLLVCIHCCRVN